MDSKILSNNEAKKPTELRIRDFENIMPDI